MFRPLPGAGWFVDDAEEKLCMAERLLGNGVAPPGQLVGREGGNAGMGIFLRETPCLPRKGHAAFWERTENEYCSRHCLNPCSSGKAAAAACVMRAIYLLGTTSSD